MWVRDQGWRSVRFRGGDVMGLGTRGVEIGRFRGGDCVGLGSGVEIGRFRGGNVWV